MVCGDSMNSQGDNCLHFDIFALMQRIKPEVDVIRDILEAVPQTDFVISLARQYAERGSLSKKQLQGLHGKAIRSGNVPPARLATLEAIIRKKPTRYRSKLPLPDEDHKKDEESGRMIEAILQKYPQHKRVLFFRSKYENGEGLTASELSDLRRFMSVIG